MTRNFLLQVLRCHLAALRSSTWPNEPALYLDEAETRVAIAELENLYAELAARRLVGTVEKRTGTSATKRQ